MHEKSLIPFGLRLPDQKFVDVSEVKRGRKCSCICPSCKTPLIARQGEINDWHFAHASKGVSFETENECEYSFWVSVTLMAKQVIATIDTIQLPSFTMYTNEAIEVQVAEQKRVSLDDVAIEQKINSEMVDATLKIGGYVIAVIFTTPDRHFDYDVSKMSGSDHAGVLEISLTNAAQGLFESNNQGKYTQVLKSNLISNENCKRWHYHPRKLVVEKKYNIELYKNRPVTSKEYGAISHSVARKQYECMACGNHWYGTHKCGNCKEHLYSREVKND